MTKIAVLSDIHGNFKNLLRIAEAAADVDKTIFLGDLFTGGNNPEACWNYLTELNPFCWILGNTDEWLLDDYDAGSLNAECQEEIRAAKAKLSQPAIKALSAIERQRQIKAGQCDIFCIHDYPEIRNGNLPAAENGLSVSKHDLILFGHTHSQLLIRKGGHIALNPGAVCEGQYAVIEITDTIKSISLLSL